MEILKSRHSIGWFRYADYILIVFNNNAASKYGTSEMQICIQKRSRYNKTEIRSNTVLHLTSFHNGIAFESVTNSILLNASCDHSEHKISAITYPINESNNYNLLK